MQTQCPHCAAENEIDPIYLNQMVKCPMCENEYQARPVRRAAATSSASPSGDYGAYKQVPRRGPVAVELTSKKHKAMQAAGCLLTAVFLVCGGFIALAFQAAGVYWFFIALAVISFFVYVYARIAAWWDRG